MDKTSLHITLKSLRESLKKSQSEVAKELKVSQPIIARWESGKRMPTLDNAVALARCYGVSLKTVALSIGIDVTGVPEDCDNSN